MLKANTALLDILVDNSLIIWSFQNRTRLFVGFEKVGLLAELQVRTSGSCRFCCFLPHTQQVSLSFGFRFMGSKRLKLQLWLWLGLQLCDLPRFHEILDLLKALALQPLAFYPCLPGWGKGVFFFSSQEGVEFFILLFTSLKTTFGDFFSSR